MKKPLVIIAGPTASGKTDLSISLAKAINGEIISADSIQVYKYMNIGSAKLEPENMQGIKHYLIDEINPDEEMNLYIFKNKAKEYINKIHESGKIPIIVGGTGFYIQAVLYDLDFEEENNDYTVRNELEKIGQEKGAHYLHTMLEDIDSVAAEQIHENNIKRVIRAIEYYRMTGEKISENNERQKKQESPYNYAFFVLNDEREKLYKRIDKRVDLMFENGLVDEVNKLINMGYNKELTSMQGIGYKEVIDSIYNSYDIEIAKDQIKQNTRHYAKRQLTWFKRQEAVNWINYNEIDYDVVKAKNIIIDILKNKNIID